MAAIDVCRRVEEIGRQEPPVGHDVERGVGIEASHVDGPLHRAAGAADR
jgi:hypothetical protein